MKEVKEGREESLSPETVTSAVPLAPLISAGSPQLPWHFLKQAIHYQTKVIHGTIEEIFHTEITEELQNASETFGRFLHNMILSHKNKKEMTMMINSDSCIPHFQISVISKKPWGVGVC